MDFKINLLFIFIVFNMGYQCNSNSSSQFSISSLSYLEKYLLCNSPLDSNYSKPEVRPEWTRFWFSRAAKNCVSFSCNFCGRDKLNFETYGECMEACDHEYIKSFGQLNFSKP